MSNNRQIADLGNLTQTVSVKDKRFGAVGNGIANDTAAFSAAAAAAPTVRVPSGTYLLNSNPTGTATWLVDDGATFTGVGRLNTNSGHVVSNVGAFRSLESDSTFYNGIFGYLEQNAAINGYGTIGLHGFARSSGGTGLAGEADLAVAACAVHDLVGSVAGVWGMYSTVARMSGVLGATHAFELDVANMGTTVPLYPHAPFAAGQTNGLWVCTGGEITESGVGSPGTASVAMGIIQNDSQVVKTAKFDKGILFHNLAIAGADGTGSGIGTAIAFASGHAMQWFNNSAQVVSEIVTTANATSGQNFRLDFSNFGLLVQDRATGQTALQIVNTANYVNGLRITPSAAGVNVALEAVGSDTKIDFQILPKGTGALKFGSFTSNADTAVTGYVVIRTNDGVTRKLATIA
jgi:hypothetical protein